MWHSNPASVKRHSENSRLRKYSEILLPRSVVSHGFGRRNRDLSPLEMNRESEPCLRPGASPNESLLRSRSRQDSTFSSNADVSAGGDSTSRPWRRLRTAIMLTSAALSSGRRDRDSVPSDDAFLDYFSTQKRPSDNTYNEQQMNAPRYEQPSQRNDYRFYFEGFNKLSDSKPIAEEEEEGEEEGGGVVDTPPSLNASSLNKPNTKVGAVETHPPIEKPLHITTGNSERHSNGSNTNIQLDKWGVLEEGALPHPQISATTYKSRCLDHLRFLEYCLPESARFTKANDSCCANPSDQGNIFQRLRGSHFIFNPQGTFMFVWLGIVAMATVYNFWTAILRQAFHEIQKGRTALWIGLDGIADLIYLADIMVQFRTSYLEKGLVVKDLRKMATRYLWSRQFLLDCVAMLPLDLLQALLGIQPLLRFPRFLKCFRAWHWKIMVENRTTFPNAWRVITLIHILFLGCHWFAGIYYMLSESTKFQDPWGYPMPDTPELQSLLRKYLQCFYWATVTLTTIGDIAEPAVTFQYAFTITTYLIGVFVFATIVGQVGNIINNRNAARLSFENILDSAKSYMSSHHVPQRLRNRVLRWYDYAWERRRLFGENDLNCLGHLPEKLKTELALHVHLETLKKVTIFHECKPEFLHDLVLKMRPYIFTPGDLICRKGEVAREMFIIADGVLEVIGKGGIVLKRLEAGDFFGEIGILCINGGGNKRTADVRAVGYAELFVLSREDVLSALADHPDAHTIIMEHATQRLIESKSREDAQVAKTQNHTDGNSSESGGSRGVRPGSTSTAREGSVAAAAAFRQMAMAGPSRPPDAPAPIPRPSFRLGPDSTIATSANITIADSDFQLQSFTAQRDALMRREKNALNSLADLNRFVEEAMFLVSSYSERIAAREERICSLMSENAELKRKLDRLNELYPESKDSWGM